MLWIILMFLIVTGFLVYNRFKEMSFKKKGVLIKGLLFLLIFFVLITVINFMPKSLMNIDVEDVTKIVIFDGNTGDSIEVVDQKELTYLVTNFNEVKIKIYDISFFRLGYSFKTSLYGPQDKVMREMIINSESDVRKTFFSYKTVNSQLDYDYILELFNRQYPDYKQ